jgi:putative DNA primase/helicase
MSTVNPNGAGWLEDPTGNRRIWPVAVGSIDADRLERDRDQLLAEAVYCFRRGDSWWIETAEQRDLLHEEQKERVIEEPWSDVIGGWASREVGQFTTVDVARGALGIDDRDIGKAEATRIGIALKKLGFSRQRVTRKEGRTWAYERQ